MPAGTVQMNLTPPPYTTRWLTALREHATAVRAHFDAARAHARVWIAQEQTSKDHGQPPRLSRNVAVLNHAWVPEIGTNAIRSISKSSPP